MIDIFEFDPPIANKPITVPQPPVITGSTIPPVSTGSTLPPIVLTGGQSPTPIITIPGVPTNVVATA